MIGEIKNSFETLLCEYPSGMRVNSLLAAKNFGVQPEEIVVGNGAAELIKAMMESLVGKTGFIRPTFEEYPNRFLKEESVVMMPETDGFRYNADDVISYFCDKDVSNLVIVNPDNPTGNYIPRADVLRLIDWAAEKGIKLIIDESFVDFSEENSTLIDSNILAKNPHLVVVKSISKSYGVPGLRLGVLASGDAKLIADIKRDVAIWNINSFGEFYMQIAEKYKSDYVLALKKFKEERRRFVELLSSFKSIRVFPSEANYLLIELCGISAEELTKNLLINDDILVKDLTQKLGGSGKEFMRIAIRNTEDNDKLIEALRKYLS